MRKTMQGFTLIEVMIVVAIVAILAAVAYPSYQDSVTKSRRADAQGVLMGFAGAMERHYTNENTYTDAGGIYTAPTETAKYYTLTIEAADSSTYTLRATPKNSQAVLVIWRYCQQELSVGMRLVVCRIAGQKAAEGRNICR